jgi:hypothetical protein
MLHPPPGIRERILGMGGFGSGKTSMWLNVAKWSQNTGSDAKFYVLDTDAAVGHMLSVPTSQYKDLENIILMEVSDFPEYIDALDVAKAAVRPGHDWTVVDFASSAWDASQEYYVAERYKAGLSQFFLDQAKAGAGDNPLDGWKDWSVINKLYKDFSKRVMESKGHVFLISGAKALGDREDRSVRALFGEAGVRPTGQKHLGHIPHTVLLTRVATPGEIYLTTIKDRERPLLEGSTQLGEFTLDYLVNVAGWSLV